MESEPKTNPETTPTVDKPSVDGEVPTKEREQQEKEMNWGAVKELFNNNPLIQELDTISRKLDRARDEDVNVGNLAEYNKRVRGLEDTLQRLLGEYSGTVGYDPDIADALIDRSKMYTIGDRAGARLVERNGAISEAEAVISAYDKNDSFLDRRPAIRKALEASGDKTAFSKVYNMSDSELTAFVDKKRSEYQELTTMTQEQANSEAYGPEKGRKDSDEVLGEAYDEYKQRNGGVSYDSARNEADIDAIRKAQEAMRQNPGSPESLQIAKILDRLEEMLDKVGTGANQNGDDTEVLNPIQPDSNEPSGDQQPPKNLKDEILGMNSGDRDKRGEKKGWYRRALSRMGDFFINGALRGADWLRNKNGEKTSRTKRVLGTVAIVGVGFGVGFATYKLGFDSSSLSPDTLGNSIADGAGAASEVAGNVADKATSSLPDYSGGHSLDGVKEVFSDAARTVNPGEGWLQTMREAGITDVSQQAGILNNDGLMNQLKDMGLAYRVPDFGGWGINMPPNGVMPQEALDLIKSTASK